MESGFLDMNKIWNDVKEAIIAAGEEIMGTTKYKREMLSGLMENVERK